MINSEFAQLADVMEQTLGNCRGEPVHVYRYGAHSAPATGFRAEVYMEGWTAGFFIWRQPVKQSGVRDLLEVRLQFSAVTDMVFPLGYTLKYLDASFSATSSYSGIRSQEEFQADLKALWGLLESHKEGLDQLAKDPQPLAQAQRKEIRAFYGKDIFRTFNESVKRSMLRNWYVVQAAPSILSEPASQQPSAPQTVGQASTSATVMAAARQQTGWLLRDSLLGALLLMPFWCVFYLLLYTVNSDFSSRGLALVIGTDWLDVILCGWITAFACALLFLRNIIWRFHKKSPQVKARLQAAVRFSTRKAQRFLAALLFLVVTGCTLHLCFYGYSGLAFGYNGFYDRTSTFPVRGVYHPYNEVSRCVLRKNAVTFLGRETTYQDYVLILKDGTSYHLTTQFGATDEQVTEVIVPLMENSNSVKIARAEKEKE